MQVQTCVTSSKTPWWQYLRIPSPPSLATVLDPVTEQTNKKLLSLAQKLFKNSFRSNSVSIDVVKTGAEPLSRGMIKLALRVEPDWRWRWDKSGAVVLRPLMNPKSTMLPGPRSRFVIPFGEERWGDDGSGFLIGSSKSLEPTAGCGCWSSGGPKGIWARRASDSSPRSLAAAPRTRWWHRRDRKQACHLGWTRAFRVRSNGRTSRSLRLWLEPVS